MVNAYFPNENPLTATLAAFRHLLYWFRKSPGSGWIFGHDGDRIGRKGTLIATLLLMGIDLPDCICAHIRIDWHLGCGDFGRFCAWSKASVSAGNGAVRCFWRWNGHVIMVSAGWLHPRPEFGVPAGLFLANLSILAFSALSGDQFATWAGVSRLDCSLY